MNVINQVRKNAYYDSATLMLLTSKVAPLVDGSDNIAVMMASDMNKEIMRNSGLLTEDGEQAAANDLIFAVRATADKAEEAIAQAERLLAQRQEEASDSKAEKPATSVAGALQRHPDANMAVVSVPGAYAPFEVKRLLKAGVNVLLFSDNVSIEREIELKKLALEKGLLMMGPDCGTAVVNGIGLGFANSVNAGNIGLVAAAGTGLQEVMTLISANGGGISQALGTGGRDVGAQVGGAMLLREVEMLEADPNTEVIGIISKPPAPQVVTKLAERLRQCSKPVVACMLGDEASALRDAGATVAPTLTDAAVECLRLAGVEADLTLPADADQAISTARSALRDDQRYLRGLYCGGTLSYEAQLIASAELGPIRSNAPLDHDYELTDVTHSVEHTILDLGDDAFTVGKPHPMIEPGLRGARLEQEMADPQTAVVVADVVLGYGSHDDPAKVLADQVRQARAHSEHAKQVAVFASVCGTPNDPQGYDASVKTLEDASVVVFDTNAQCVQAAVKVVAR